MVPAFMPVTMPEMVLMLATVSNALLHEPPVGLLDRLVVLPIHTDALPPIAVGSAFTVNAVVL